MAGNGSSEPSTGIRSLKALQATAAIAQQRPRLRECSGLRGKAAFRWAGADQHKLELEGEINSQRKKFAGLSDRVPNHSRGFSTHYARVRDRKAETSLFRTCGSGWSGDSSQRSSKAVTFCPRVRSMSGLFFMRATASRSITIYFYLISMS